MRRTLKKVAVTLSTVAGVILTQATAAHGSFNWK